VKAPGWVRRARLALYGAALVLISVPGAAAASGADVTRVSRASPFAACSTPVVDAPIFVNAEVEPDVDTNPNDPQNVIGVWQQDRWGDGGAHGIMAGFSFNGGRTWGRTPLPFSVCAPGGLSYERASDPAVSIGPDGTAYAIGLSFDQTTSRSAVASVVSRDGGRTWSRLRVIATDNDAGLDKEWITADPVRPGTAYAVWDNLHVDASGHFTGPAYFSKTTDSGQTWSTPIAIAAKGLDEQTLGNQILVDAGTGRLYDTYAFYFCICPSIPKIAYVMSDDGGRTWSRQRVISNFTALTVEQPGSVIPVRSGGFPVGAISPTGRVYVAWEDSRFSGFNEIAVATSRDGTHWTKPHRANRATGRPAFVPSIAVAASGKAGITYYDVRRDDIGDTPFTTDYWATTTRDGVHFRGDRHLAGPFDLLAAPFAFGLFVGDYEGLAPLGQGFVTLFSMSNCRFDGACVDRNSTDIYSTRFGANLGGKARSPTPAGAARMPLRRATAHPVRPTR
jgi:hypothetical protein